MEKTKVMDAQTLGRTIMRISHEILEGNKDFQKLILIGIQTRGTYLAKRIQENVFKIEGLRLPLGFIDVTFHRDDIGEKGIHLRAQKTEMPFDLNDKHIILVDDVLFSGRTIRAAIDELMDYGRAKTIQLAVLVDRGHRELPIRPDYVGKNIPTAIDERINVLLSEVDGEDEISVVKERS